jgi:hypothetical protein
MYSVNNNNYLSSLLMEEDLKKCKMIEMTDILQLYLKLFGMYMEEIFFILKAKFQII